MSYSGKLCALAILGMPAISLAQEATKPGAGAPVKASVNVDPAAEKIAAESEVAFRSAKDLSFEMTVQEKQGEKKAVMAVIQPAPAQPKQADAFSAIIFPEVYRVSVLGKNGEKKTEWSSDGKTLWKIDHAGKKVVSLELEQKTPPPMDIMGFFPPGLWMPVAPGAKLIYSKLEGESEIDGLRCRTLKQVQELELPKGLAPVAGTIVVKTMRYIAPDMLPRKIELTIKIPGALLAAQGEKGGDNKTPKADVEETMVVAFTGLKVNSGLKPVDMVTKTPEGYSVEKGTRAAMGYPSRETPNREMPRLNAEVGKPAIAFSLKTPEGKEVTLESLKGRIVVLDFWATWCGPCKLAMPSLQKLHEKYADKPVSIIGVNCMEQDPDEAVKYTKKEKFTYMQLLQGDDLAQEYGVSGIPTLIVIDAEGKVLGSEIGFSPELEKKLSARIDKALTSKPAATEPPQSR
ncbi:redoxin domain-containing protein [bacterium]|nr:redoxin domain-containing protein [bacterium]